MTKFVLFITVSSLLLSACMHRPLPNLDKNHRGTIIDANHLDDKPGVATAQLLIMYGPAGCNHTATRFYCPGKGALFWDPGGGYGTKGYVHVDRSEDIITTNTPTLNDYLHWRTLIPTVATEIFVWEGHDTICELYDLIDAASRKERLRNFTSKTTGLFCGAATSKFFQDYASDLMQVKKWGLPHNLSKELHQQQSADKIYIVNHNTQRIQQYYP